MEKRLSLIARLIWLADCAVIVLAWIAAYHLRFSTDLVPLLKGVPKFHHYFILTPFILAIWSGLFIFFDLYQVRRISSFSREILQLLKANTLALLTFVTFTYLYNQYEFSRIFLLYFWSFNLLFLVGARGLARSFVRELRKSGYNLRHVIIIGTGHLAQTVSRKLQNHPELGLRVVGFVAPPHSGKPGTESILGTFDDLTLLLDEYQPDQLFVALSPVEFAELEPRLRRIAEGIVDICIVPGIDQFMTLSCTVENFEGMPVVHINDSPLKDSWNRFQKRIFDILFALTALFLTLPVQLLVALLIKFTSRGPLFYAQERMGLDGSTFMMYKFRSMRLNAEEKTGAVWAVKDDDRATAIGRWLRRTSLDELPQFYNVLKGDMSIVGPRPERPIFVEQFSQDIPKYMLRHKVKSGITGWAQVHGWRGNTSMEKRIEFDLYYIKNWSLLLDLKILFLTLWKGFIHQNAY